MRHSIVRDIYSCLLGKSHADCPADCVSTDKIPSPQWRPCWDEQIRAEATRGQKELTAGTPTWLCQIWVWLLEQGLVTYVMFYVDRMRKYRSERRTWEKARGGTMCTLERIWKRGGPCRVARNVIRNAFIAPGQTGLLTPYVRTRVL